MNMNASMRGACLPALTITCPVTLASVAKTSLEIRNAPINERHAGGQKMPKFHFGIIADWIRVGGRPSAALPANGILWKGRQQEGLDGLDRCPGSFFFWNRRPRNRSFQPAHVVSLYLRPQPIGHPVHIFGAEVLVPGTREI